MKKIFALALALLPAPAVAADLICALNVDGTEMVYSFESNGRDMIEVSVEKNGSTLTHAPHKRPVWTSTTIDDSAVMLTYVPDPRFKIITGGDGEMIKGTNLRGFKAAIGKGTTKIGSGACGFRDTRRRSPRPEKF